MESRILLMGPVGAGKTTAIRTISDIDVIDTDVLATDEVAAIKDTTTVAMDMGVMQVDAKDRVVLYGAPGQDRFDFMWEILIAQCDAIILVLDHSAPDSVAQLDKYCTALTRMRIGQRPLLICVTHVDIAQNKPISIYNAHLHRLRSDGSLSCVPAVQQMDARAYEDVRAVMTLLAAVLEMRQRGISQAAT